MTPDQKNKYEQQAASIFPMEMIGGGITKTDRQLQQNAFIKGAEHAHPIAHSEGWNDAIDSVISMIKVGPEQVYIHSGKIYDELQKLRK